MRLYAAKLALKQRTALESKQVLDALFSNDKTFVTELRTVLREVVKENDLREEARW